MGIYKQYVFKCLYIQSFIEDMIKKGFLAEGSGLHLNDDSEILITITSDDGADSVFVLISDNVTNESLLGYQDNGETIRYLKCLGRLSSAAFIASCLKNGQQFYLIDKNNHKYGIARVDLMDNSHIVIGGYENPIGFLNIVGMAPKQVTDFVLRKLISDDHEFCSFDPKTLHICITKKIGVNLNANIFAKPYVILMD